jgi:hypothetical protein
MSPPTPRGRPDDDPSEPRRAVFTSVSGNRHLSAGPSTFWTCPAWTCAPARLRASSARRAIDTLALVWLDLRGLIDIPLPG